MNWNMKLSLNENPKYTGILFFVFLVLGFLLSMPCLCLEGAVRGQYKNILFILILIRLLFDIFRGRLKYSTLAIYSVIFVLFCILIEKL